MTSSAVDIATLQETMLEFRAGKMSLEGIRVVPDARKGLVRIGRGEEGLVHFQWLDHTHNIVEDDQIIFPDEAVFEKVTQSSGRVYILKFTSDSRRFFFWMQEPKSDEDLHICNSVNCCINHPIDMMGEDDADASVPLLMSEMSEDTTEDDLASRGGNLLDQNVAGELAGEVTSSSGPGPVQLADLQRILRSIQLPGVVEDPDVGLGLGDIFKPDLISPLIETLPLEHRLRSYLPEGSGSIMEIIQSAPFRQQVDIFSDVLRTGQIDLTQFGIDPSKFKCTVLSFLEALEDSVSKESSEADLRQDENKDTQSQRRSGGDFMDES